MGIKSDIVGLLGSADVARVSFRLFEHTIRGNDYSRIAGAIRNGHIQIAQATVDPDRGGSWDSRRAFYERTYNSFLVGSAPSPNLVVHEATHALNDWHARSLMPVEDEGLAYVAQAIFLCQQDPTMTRAVLDSGFQRNTSRYALSCGDHGGATDCNRAVVGYSFTIAAVLSAGETPSADLLQRFQQALYSDPGTARRDQRRVYDSITRVEIPAAGLARFGASLVSD